VLWEARTCSRQNRYDWGGYPFAAMASEHRQRGRTQTSHRARSLFHSLRHTTTSILKNAGVNGEFARRLAKDEVSLRHAETFRETLKKLEARFGSQLVSEITTEAVREWLLGLPLAPSN
jgi:hypothetical protein